MANKLMEEIRGEMYLEVHSVKVRMILQEYHAELQRLQSQADMLQLENQELRHALKLAQEQQKFVFIKVLPSKAIVHPRVKNSD